VGKDRTAIGIDELCAQLGITRPTWYNLLKRGDAPPHFNVGSRVLISTEAVAAWLAERETARVKSGRAARLAR
jgi:excisionase family DNA binding protein